MRSESPAITVVVPAYNVRRYITFCIDSILEQTFQDFELIIVDDGSADDTYKICKDKYSHLNGVKLLRNPLNKGQGYARNIGIVKGKGKYIYFVDSDDELLPGALETLYKKAEAEKADVVHANLWAQVYSEDRMILREYLWKPFRCKDSEEGLFEGDAAYKIIQQGSQSMPMPWMNLYRRDFLLKEGIEFPEMVIGEDVVFSTEVCLKAKRYIRVNELFYLYRCYFDQRERMRKRLPKAFTYIPLFLKSWNRIFDNFSEEELPFTKKVEFITGWLRAHLGFCVYDIMDTDEKASFDDVMHRLQTICPEGNEFVAYLINMLQHTQGISDKKNAEREGKIGNANKFFDELTNGNSIFLRNFSRIYCEAKLAAYIDGGGDAFYCRVYKLLADASLELGKYQEAREAYGKAASFAPLGSDEFFRAQGKKLAAKHYLSCSDEDLVKEYNMYAQSMADISCIGIRHEESKGRKKIRIGVLSPYFCEHDVFFVNYGLLFCYNREQFEVFCYHCGTVNDGYTTAVRNQVDRFAYVEQLSYKERAELICQDEIDILIDLGGRHVEETLPVFAYRPAPLQVAGVERLPLADTNMIDCYIVDDVVMPPEAGKDLSAKLLHLPCGCSYAMRSESEPSQVAPTAINGVITFGTVVHYRQIDDATLALWRELMEKVPDSVLLVKTDEFVEKAMIVEALDRFTVAGFDTSRVGCKAIGKDSLSEYRDMDIFLGTYPMQDSARLLNALYMGVPAVVLCGSRCDNMISKCILGKIGVPELAVSTKEEYIGKAVELARNTERLNTMHKNLRSKLKVASALNPAIYTRKLEMELRKFLTVALHGEKENKCMI